MESRDNGFMTGEKEKEEQKGYFDVRQCDYVLHRRVKKENLKITKASRQKKRHHKKPEQEINIEKRRRHNENRRTEKKLR